MRTTALLFHDVVSDSRYDASGFAGADADIYKLDVRIFEDHLNAIAATARGGMTTADRLSPEGSNVLLTFDDGGVSALTHTAGLLRARGWLGHFFMTTDCIGKAGFLGDSELRELRRQGHLIGSHSCSHPPRMTACAPDTLLKEWAESRARLEAILGETVVTASVPGGYYNRAVAKAAAAAGIRVLFTSEPVTRTEVVDGCLVVGRFSIHQGVSPDWAAAVAAHRMTPRALRYVSWNGKKVLKAVGGNAWLSARRLILARSAKIKRRSEDGDRTNRRPTPARDHRTIHRDTDGR